MTSDPTGGCGAGRGGVGVDAGPRHLRTLKASHSGGVLLSGSRSTERLEEAEKEDDAKGRCVGEIGVRRRLSLPARPSQRRSKKAAFFFLLFLFLFFFFPATVPRSPLGLVESSDRLQEFPETKPVAGCGRKLHKTEESPHQDTSQPVPTPASLPRSPSLSRSLCRFSFMTLRRLHHSASPMALEKT